jgi:hypothetical protein
MRIQEAFLTKITVKLAIPLCLADPWVPYPSEWVHYSCNSCLWPIPSSANRRLSKFRLAHEGTRSAPEQGETLKICPQNHRKFTVNHRKIHREYHRKCTKTNPRSLCAATTLCKKGSRLAVMRQATGTRTESCTLFRWGIKVQQTCNVNRDYLSVSSERSSMLVPSV